ncbi:MAG: glycyl-radical enzyme activating protein [Bacteroidales bacterium]|nr:glycyl-radical enzyme activating protein [Bacteroidales bacterium]
MDRTKLIHGTLFDIQGFSVHDGPGCRTLIFLKGCSLHCAWCSNPEGISPYPEPLYQISKCTFDGLCIEACPHHAIKQNLEHLVFDRSLCSTCNTFECTSACCSGALRKGGFQITVDTLFKKITRDRQYWGEGGGITLTGGEPFTQSGFVQALLKRCYETFIHTAVETCGNVPWKNIEPCLPWLDWIFFDLKHIDSKKHKQCTGSSNHLILQSAAKLAISFPGRIIFRMPVIPGFNDDSDHIASLCDFILSTGRQEINLLPVHHFGREKYNLLGQTYYTKEFNSIPHLEIERIRSQMEMSGIRCYTGSETPF